MRAGLEHALRDAIQTGQLHPGARLPSSRALALDLGVARNTVAEAYGQLVAEGWLAARQGSGTRVADRPAITTVAPARDVPRAGRIRYDLRPGRPDLAMFPRSAWLAAARRALTAAPYDALGYGDPRGRPELRAALAEYLSRVRGVRATADRIVVCTGYVQALGLLFQVRRAGGRQRLAMEAYGLPDHRRVAAAKGLQVRTLPIDAAGADVAGIDRVDSVLLTPAHQFPLGLPLAPDRRRQVVEWANEGNGLVIEDDYDGEFRYDRQAVGAMQALAPEHVVYAGTASKAPAPKYKTDKAGAVTIALGANRDLRKAYEANVDAGDALAATDLAATSHGLSSSISHTTTIVIAMLGLVIVLGAALLILFARSLRRRLATLAAACDQLATGDLDATFEASGDDEVSGLARSLGTAVGSLRALADTSQRVAAGDLTVTVEPRSDKDSLGVSFAAMVENLRGIVAEVTSTARTISSSTTQMAATSSDAGRTAGEIARAVDDVAQGAQRQVIMIDETRTSAEQAAGVANDAQIVAREGVESADKAGNAMEALQESSTAMTGAMGSLQEKIERIGGMVSTITAIADQTNLLALNAAIEAARAGEQGRGFAVVAEEVRKLAEECQGAASQISGLIGQIQSETTRAVDVVEDGSRRTAEGVEVVERARDSFLRLGGAVDEMASMIGRIAAATAEVASVTEQSSASAQQVSASTQETSSSAEEIAASARSLADTAVMLTDAVGRFQTNA